jgi:protoporphyrinogen oxidase
MKIALIGAGFTGLSAALCLSRSGHEVTVFEKKSHPGGLALGFKDPKWEWTLEEHYHHWFTNDNKILSLAKELGHPVIIKQPQTTVYVKGKFYKLDSPIDVLKFPELTFFERLRMGLSIAFLKYNPFWKPLEKYKTSVLLPKIMGEKPYKTLWEPLIIKKFGPFANDISLAWFWARIAKRTSALAYPKGGFSEFTKTIVSTIQRYGGKILYDTEVKNIIAQKDGKISINDLIFDKAIVTLPSALFARITPQLPLDYKSRLLNLKELSVINLVLRLKQPFFYDKTYWLNICDTKYPLTGIVEHTNFIDKKHYNNEHILYLLNYITQQDSTLKMNKDELLKRYDPLLRRINKDYKSDIIDSHLFVAEHAQPIIPTNYSKIIPPLKTPLKNIYLANMQQIYPWDRGTNYAIGLGEEIAKVLFQEN